MSEGNPEAYLSERERATLAALQQKMEAGGELDLSERQLLRGLREKMMGKQGGGQPVQASPVQQRQPTIGQGITIEDLIMGNVPYRQAEAAQYQLGIPDVGEGFAQNALNYALAQGHMEGAPPQPYVQRSDISSPGDLATALMEGAVNPTKIAGAQEGLLKWIQQRGEVPPELFHRALMGE